MNEMTHHFDTKDWALPAAIFVGSEDGGLLEGGSPN